VKDLVSRDFKKMLEVACFMEKVETLIDAGNESNQSNEHGLLEYPDVQKKKPR